MTNNPRRLVPSSLVTLRLNIYVVGARYASVGPSGGISVRLVQGLMFAAIFFSHRSESLPSASINDAIICIDACFTQKRRSGHEDDPRNPTGTVFLPQTDLDEMEGNVEALRNPPRTSKPTARRKGGHTVDQVQDTYEDGMRIPTSVLDGCNDSFLAADETRQKVRHCKVPDRY
jgi:hypothetical protein